MSFDLSWLWNWLSSVANQIAQWLQSIWGSVSQIQNVGQGILAGLASVASAIWDALVKFGEAFKGAFQWIYNGFSAIGQAIYSFGQWLWSALVGIPHAIYAFGQWIWNGILWVINGIVGILSSVWNFIVNGIEWLWNSLVSAFGNLANAVNAWFTNVVAGMRSKIKQMIRVDLTLYMTWNFIGKTIERGSLKGLLLSPLAVIGGILAGELLGAVIDAVTPSGVSNTFKVVPDQSLPQLQLPRLSITGVPQPSIPGEIGISIPSTPPSAPGIITGTSDESLELPNIRVDYSTNSNTLSLSAPIISVETEVR